MIWKLLEFYFIRHNYQTAGSDIQPHQGMNGCSRHTLNYSNITPPLQYLISPSTHFSATIYHPEQPFVWQCTNTKQSTHSQTQFTPVCHTDKPAMKLSGHILTLSVQRTTKIRALTMILIHAETDREAGLASLTTEVVRGAPSQHKKIPTQCHEVL